MSSAIQKTHAGIFSELNAGDATGSSTQSMSRVIEEALTFLQEIEALDGT